MVPNLTYIKFYCIIVELFSFRSASGFIRKQWPPCGLKFALIRFSDYPKYFTHPQTIHKRHQFVRDKNKQRRQKYIRCPLLSSLTRHVCRPQAASLKRLVFPSSIVTTHSSPSIGDHLISFNSHGVLISINYSYL